MGLLFRVIVLTFLIFNISYASDLKQKIGQMLILGFNGKQVEPSHPIVQGIQKQQIGGVILFDYDYQTKQYSKNIESPAQLRNLTQTLQSYSPDLPLLISIDYEGGFVNRLSEKYGFPPTKSAQDLAKLNNTEIEKEISSMAEVLSQSGINLNFAPVLDLNLNPDNPIIGRFQRSFSADPARVAEIGLIFSKIYARNHIGCAYKHFPGHGSSNEDSHLGFVDVTQTWQQQELLPYQILLSHPEHCDFILMAHVVNKQLDPEGYPASLSKTIITDLLKKKLHFTGLVVSDDMQMQAITEEYTLDQAVVLAINAGVDLLVFGNQLSSEPQNPQEIIDIIYANIQKGLISEEQIERSYEKIVGYRKKLLPLLPSSPRMRGPSLIL